MKLSLKEETKKESELEFQLSVENLRRQREIDITWGMSDFVLIELSTATLASLIAYCARETMLEEQKATPNLIRLKNIKGLVMEFHAINNEWANFSDLETMRNIIRKYSPMLRKVNEGEQLV